MKNIPLNCPHRAARELDILSQVLETRRLSADGWFTRACEAWLGGRDRLSSRAADHVLHRGLGNGRDAVGVGPGDEVIMPSFTFPSTANAFVLRGATPVFVDIREDTLCIDEAAIEDAINEHTRAIVPMHYGGVGCDMRRIMETAKAARAYRDRRRGAGALRAS